MKLPRLATLRNEFTHAAKLTFGAIGVVTTLAMAVGDELERGYKLGAVIGAGLYLKSLERRVTASEIKRSAEKNHAYRI